MRSITLPTGVALAVKSERDESALAAESFRHALGGKARLRRSEAAPGRVLGRLGHHEKRADRAPSATSTKWIMSPCVTSPPRSLGREEEMSGTPRRGTRGATGEPGRCFRWRSRRRLRSATSPVRPATAKPRWPASSALLDLPVNDMDRRDPPVAATLLRQADSCDEWFDELYRPFRHKAGP